MDKQLKLLNKQVGWIAANSCENDTLRLEAAMTQSTFGCEYALLSLEESNLTYMRREEVMAEIQAHREMYFEARELLKTINPQKLIDIEFDLAEQKKVLFQANITIH